MFPFFKITQENKPLRKSYEVYFINKTKSLLNKTTKVAKPTKVAVVNITSTSLIPRKCQISKTNR